MSCHKTRITHESHWSSAVSRARTVMLRSEVRLLWDPYLGLLAGMVLVFIALALVAGQWGLGQTATTQIIRWRHEVRDSWWGGGAVSPIGDFLSIQVLIGVANAVCLGLVEADVRRRGSHTDRRGDWHAMAFGLVWICSVVAVLVTVAVLLFPLGAGTFPATVKVILSFVSLVTAIVVPVRAAARAFPVRSRDLRSAADMRRRRAARVVRRFPDARVEPRDIPVIRDVDRRRTMAFGVIGVLVPTVVLGAARVAGGILGVRDAFTAVCVSVGAGLVLIELAGAYAVMLRRTEIGLAQGGRTMTRPVSILPGIVVGAAFVLDLLVIARRLDSGSSTQVFFLTLISFVASVGIELLELGYLLEFSRRPLSVLRQREVARLLDDCRILLRESRLCGDEGGLYRVSVRRAPIAPTASAAPQPRGGTRLLGSRRPHRRP